MKNYNFEKTYKVFRDTIKKHPNVVGCFVNYQVTKIICFQRLLVLEYIVLSGFELYV